VTTNPIPLWGHLYISEIELRQKFAAASHPQAVVDAAVDWSFFNNQITHLPRWPIIELIQAGLLRMQALREDRVELPRWPLQIPPPVARSKSPT